MKKLPKESEFLLKIINGDINNILKSNFSNVGFDSESEILEQRILRIKPLFFNNKEEPLYMCRYQDDTLMRIIYINRYGVPFSDYQYIGLYKDDFVSKFEKSSLFYTKCFESLKRKYLKEERNNIDIELELDLDKIIFLIQLLAPFNVYNYEGEQLKTYFPNVEKISIKNFILQIPQEELKTIGDATDYDDNDDSFIISNEEMLYFYEETINKLWKY